MRCSVWWMTAEDSAIRRRDLKKESGVLYGEWPPRTEPRYKRSSNRTRGSSRGSSILPSFQFHECPDPWRQIKKCLKRWAERVFRFYERHVRENSRARKRETTLYNTAKVTQPRPKIAAALRQDTAREKVLNGTVNSQKTKWKWDVFNTRQIIRYWTSPKSWLPPVGRLLSEHIVRWLRWTRYNLYDD